MQCGILQLSYKEKNYSGTKVCSLQTSVLPGDFSVVHPQAAKGPFVRQEMVRFG